ncbi:hypothetical protein [Raoultibacter phocaeensis]|nr:hypothetical protein [Raoultibacter phocaeensis]
MTVEFWMLVIALAELVIRVVDFIIDKFDRLPSNEALDKEPKT